MVDLRFLSKVPEHSSIQILNIPFLSADLYTTALDGATGFITSGSVSKEVNSRVTGKIMLTSGEPYLGFIPNP